MTTQSELSFLQKSGVTNMKKKPAPIQFDPWERYAELEGKRWEELTAEERNEMEWLKEKIDEIETEQRAWEELYGEDEE